VHPNLPTSSKPGITFNSEPAIYLNGVGGMRHCETVAGRKGALKSSLISSQKGIAG
jgi:hypothetical protein